VYSNVKGESQTNLEQLIDATSLRSEWSAHKLWGTDWSCGVEYDSTRKEGTMYIDGRLVWLN